MLLDDKTMRFMARPRSRPGRRGLFAERLRSARRARGLTQEQASVEIGVSRTTLALWETGDGRPVGPALRYLEIWIQAAHGEPINLPGLTSLEEGDSQ